MPCSPEIATTVADSGNERSERQFLDAREASTGSLELHLPLPRRDGLASLQAAASGGLGGLPALLFSRPGRR